MAEIITQDMGQFAFRLKLHADEEGGEEIRWHGYENKKLVIVDDEPYTSFWRRLGVGIMSLLPIESQL